jgi:hypothetical protein
MLAHAATRSVRAQMQRSCASIALTVCNIQRKGAHMNTGKSNRWSIGMQRWRCKPVRSLYSVVRSQYVCAFAGSLSHLPLRHRNRHCARVHTAVMHPPPLPRVRYHPISQQHRDRCRLAASFMPRYQLPHTWQPECFLLLLGPQDQVLLIFTFPHSPD